MYGFGGLGLSEVQLSISELSVVGGWWTRQTHFMVGPSQGPTKKLLLSFNKLGTVKNTTILQYSAIKTIFKLILNEYHICNYLAGEKERCSKSRQH